MHHNRWSTCCDVWFFLLSSLQTSWLFCCFIFYSSVLKVLHSVEFCGWLVRCWVTAVWRGCVCMRGYLMWAVHVDGPEGTGSLQCDHTSYQRHIKGLSMSLTHHVEDRLVYRRNHMLPYQHQQTDASYSYAGLEGVHVIKVDREGVWDGLRSPILHKHSLKSHFLLASSMSLLDYQKLQFRFHKWRSDEKVVDVLVAWHANFAFGVNIP